ncbi:gas vesicle protein [Bacillus sp. AFS001701]|uniref:gas vesicle protein n=1 Tax=Bacillus sp. AFS001701 TaxID=2033480 RepID=UPI000BF7BC97|nr:gas vesicle protein [Bacillus sp. AFS001701]PET55997.1 gas vesicle protein [Bacillus sp. AFS001701]
MQRSAQSTNILDILEKILDKGIVIAGDIKIALADVELLTIKIRLVVASIDKAMEIGLNWWQDDPYFNSSVKGKLLHDRINRIEDKLGIKQEE